MAAVLKRFGFMFAMGLVGSLLGCGGGDEKESAGAKPASERIVGNWEGQASISDEALKKFMEDNGVPEDQRSNFKSELEKGKFYFSFEEGGTGKAAMFSGGDVDFDDVKWKVESENGDHALIALTSDSEGDGKLDVTFQEDGTAVAKVIPPEKHKDGMPDLSIKLKKVDKLPEETAAKTPVKTFEKTPDLAPAID